MAIKIQEDIQVWADQQGVFVGVPHKEETYQIYSAEEALKLAGVLICAYRRLIRGPGNQGMMFSFHGTVGEFDLSPPSEEKEENLGFAEELYQHLVSLQDAGNDEDESVFTNGGSYDLTDFDPVAALKRTLGLLMKIKDANTKSLFDQAIQEDERMAQVFDGYLAHVIPMKTGFADADAIVTWDLVGYAHKDVGIEYYIENVSWEEVG